MLDTQSIAQAIVTQAQNLGAESIAVAFSGGLDSRVLLQLVSTIQAVPIRAIHVHHGLSESADHWVEQAKAVCQQLNVPLSVEYVQVDTRKAGIEAGAREARYQAFAQSLPKKTLLVTGQHQDDQAETLLLRLFRGAGPEGLAAMPSLRVMDFGWLYRPLLGVARQELEAYAQQQGLSWVEDDSNSDNRFDRNYLRNHILPQLAQRWPGVAERIASSSELCAQQNQLLGDKLDELMARVEDRPEAFGRSMALPALANLSTAEQAVVLRRWLQPEVPERKHLNEIDLQLVSGRQDAKACVVIGSIQLRRFASRLYRLSLPELSVGLGQLLTKPGRYPLPLGELEIAEDPEGEFCLSHTLEQQPIYLGYRLGGERAKPCDRHRSQSLKKLFQERGRQSEMGLEPWLRDAAPLIFADQARRVLLAAPGQWLSFGYCPKTCQAPQPIRYRLHWHL